jgi:hypothetical protein
MFRKKIINVFSNLKRSLHLGTKIKSNQCLDIGTDGVLIITCHSLTHKMYKRAKGEHHTTAPKICVSPTQTKNPKGDKYYRERKPTRHQESLIMTIRH